MNGNICFNKNIFLVFVVLIIVCILFLPNLLKKINPVDEINTTTQSQVQAPPKTPSNTVHKHIHTIERNQRPMSKDEILYRRDSLVVKNPLVAPTRRNPSYMYPRFQIPLSYPTRGYPDSYQYYGNLRRTADEKVVRLFARQKYRNSNQYEYYGMVSDLYGKDIKIQIDHKKELYDGDEIDVDFLDTSKGKFKLYINKIDTPEYHPHHY